MKPKKYPRTYHLPWSKGITSDDKVVNGINHFIGKRVVVTEKMDGENTSLYRDNIHARSVDSRHHPSRDWVKGFWSGFRHLIPDWMVIRGENLYAKHSIHYHDLPSYFMGFAIEDLRDGVVLSFDATWDWFDYFGITHVPVLYEGQFSREVLMQFETDDWLSEHEGYVVRLVDEFEVDRFQYSVNKFVREGHVQTNEHWMTSEIVKNGLRG